MPPEQPVGHVGLDDHHLGAAQLALGEEPAAQQGAALDVHVVVVGAEDVSVWVRVALVLHPLEQLHPHAGVGDLRHPRDRLGVGRGARPAGSAPRRAGWSGLSGVCEKNRTT